MHEYRLRTVFAEVALPWSWPVLVNFHEAKAFAAWKTSREAQVTDSTVSNAQILAL